MKYKREAEGALFQRSGGESLHQCSGRNPLPEPGSTSFEEVLEEFERPAKQILKKFKINPKVQASELPATCSEVVRDAHEMVNQIELIRRFVAESSDPERARAIFALSYGLGRLSVQQLLRLDGTEAAVYGRQKQQKNLRARPRVEVDPEELETEWNRVKEANPEAKKNVWYRKVCTKLGVSETTVKRLLKAAGIT